MEETTPIVVDLGKAKRKHLKELKRGEGRLAAEVKETIEHVRQELGPEVAGKVLLPVIVIYEKKQKRRAGMFPFMK
jgi:hypothetical protein